MKCILILAVVMAASLSLGQDVKHAPTVEQCQADQRLWLSKVEGDVTDKTLPAISVINAWLREMFDCEKIDPENQRRYYNTRGELYVEEVMRMEDFLRRHQMWDRFIKEDAAGKR